MHFFCPIVMFCHGPIHQDSGVVSLCILQHFQDARRTLGPSFLLWLTHLQAASCTDTAIIPETCLWGHTHKSLHKTSHCFVYWNKLAKDFHSDRSFLTPSTGTQPFLICLNMILLLLEGRQLSHESRLAGEGSRGLTNADIFCAWELPVSKKNNQNNHWF